MQAIIENENKIFWLYVTTFFLSLQYGTIAYSASTYFSELLHTENIWFIYSCGAALSLVLNFFASRVLHELRINKLFARSILLSILTTGAIFYTSQPLMICILYIIFYGITSLVYTLASVSLEEFSKHTTTGVTRGFFNATVSSAYLLGPFLSSFFLPFFGIKFVFALSCVIGIAAYMVFRYYAELTKHYNITPQSTRGNLRKLFKNRDILYIVITQLGINAFYTGMVVFLPFKLLSLGITLPQYLSVLLPVALSPFLIIPPVLGTFEDKTRNEKTILMLAIFGMIGALVTMANMETHSLFAWGIVMLCARMCASSAETSTNSYFYKRVKAEEVSLISIFVSTEFISYLVFTPIFTLLNIFADTDTVFLTVSFFFTFVLVLVSKIHNLAKYEEHQKFQKNWKEIWKRAKRRTA